MKKMLLVVDFQKDFVDGSLGFQKAVELDKEIANRIKQAKKDGEIIIFTMDTHKPDYLETQEGKTLPVEHCIEGSDGWELYGETGKTIENPIYVKKSAFGGLGLIEALKPYENENLEIEICGVVTNMCVISNAVICKATLPESPITINSKLCASFDDVLHAKAIDVMESMQMKII